MSDEVTYEQVGDAAAAEVAIPAEAPPMPVAPPAAMAAPTEMPSETAFDPKTGLVPRTLGQLQKLADVFAASSLVPTHFQKKPADCFVALQMAYRMGLDPMTALQNIHVVHGCPGLSAQLVISLANRSGVFRSPLRWREAGTLGKEDFAVTCVGVLQDGEEVSFTVSMAMAKAEGWTKNAKYSSMPQLMLRYRSATMLVRLTCPEVIIGMHTADEWEDVAAADGVQARKAPATTGIAGDVLGELRSGRK